MAWKSTIDWGKHLGPPPPSKQPSDTKTVQEPSGVNLNNLPAQVTLANVTWYRSEHLSHNRTYSYVDCPSASMVETNCAAKDHITVVGSANSASSVIQNVHYTYVADNSRVRYFPDTKTYDGQPPQTLVMFVNQVFFKLVTYKLAT